MTNRPPDNQESPSNADSPDKKSRSRYTPGKQQRKTREQMWTWTKYFLWGSGILVVAILGVFAFNHYEFSGGPNDKPGNNSKNNTVSYKKYKARADAHQQAGNELFNKGKSTEEPDRKIQFYRKALAHYRKAKEALLDFEQETGSDVRDREEWEDASAMQDRTKDRLYDLDADLTNLPEVSLPDIDNPSAGMPESEPEQEVLEFEVSAEDPEVQATLDEIEKHWAEAKRVLRDIEELEKEEEIEKRLPDLEEAYKRAEDQWVKLKKENPDLAEFDFLEVRSKLRSVHSELQTLRREVTTDGAQEPANQDQEEQ